MSRGHSLSIDEDRKAASDRRMPPPHDEPASLNDVLDDIAYKAANDDTPDSLTLGEVLDSVGRRTYGPLLLVIGLIAISPLTALPGTTWLVAALTLLVAGQMALGLKSIWLPRKARDMNLPRDGVTGAVEKMRGVAKVIDTLLKPRLRFLSGPPFVNVVALLVIGAALITFPLGLVPLLPLAPGLAIVFFGLGMTARDGLWLLLGAAAVGGAFWLGLPQIFRLFGGA